MYYTPTTTSNTGPYVSYPYTVPSTVPKITGTGDGLLEARNQIASNMATIQLLKDELAKKGERMLYGGDRCHLCNAAMKVRKQSALTKYGKKGKIRLDTLVNEIKYRCGTKVVRTTELNAEPVYRTHLGEGCIIPPARQLSSGDGH